MTVKGNIPKFYLVPIQLQTDVKERSRQIKHRLERLEDGQKNLKADQKWPTQKTMSLHLYHQLSAVPDIVVVPPTPRHSSGWDSPQPANAKPSQRMLDRILAPAITPRAEFPYSISTRDSSIPVPEVSFIDSSFIYFTFLPVELRLQIWEIELKRPKFIEAQFSSQFYSPTFVGSCTRGSPLLSVCKESREIALSLPHSFLTPTQRDLGKKWSRSPHVPMPIVPEKPLPFIPERDTIFFRSLDRPQGGLQSLACSVTGFENIQHLALPLQKSGLPLRNEWKMCLGLFRDLKTLTFLVGGKDQSWVGEEEIELRNIEEWFVDGRERMMKCDGWSLDVAEIGRFLSGANFEERMKGSWDDEWNGVNARVVAWKKGE